ncbi:MAG: zinc ABC transporter substrate-binding protein [Oscillospiraceae bacterium]|jgi:zinc transport system substrate-binding protein|nr:zinc ABC transporter substrate-binding protein [Oscillospiraceae bacterium]
MKRAISMMVMLALAVTFFAAGSAPAYAADKVSIVATNFPPYDYIRQIAGDLVDLKMLLPPAAESHSYEPSPRDIIDIQNADLMLYAGGENDAWVDRILSSMGDAAPDTLAMLDIVDAVEEEIVEGMEHEHEEEEETVFDPSAIRDRPIRDFDGEWKSILPLVEDGALNEYIQNNANANEVEFDAQRNTTIHRLRSDYPEFSLYNGVATLNGVSALYEYDGFRPTSSSAWYILKLADGTPGMPGYLMFNDHGIGNADAQDAHDHGSEGVAHTHFKYGDDVDDIMAVESWSTFYVAAGASDAEIKMTMLGLTKEEYVSRGLAYADEYLIKDRPSLVDWNGDWQSLYPYIGDGSLDKVWEAKNAANDAKTPEEYKEAALYNYNTDVDRLVIKGESITFYTKDKTVSARYEYMGTVRIFEGTWWVRYAFKAVGETNGAPRYILYSDHLIEPTVVEHFHLYMGDDYDALVNNSTIYPTYYPASLTTDEIADEMIGHDSGAHSHDHEREGEEAELDEHVWTSPKNAKLIVARFAEELSALDPDNAGTYRANAAAYLAQLDELDAAFRGVVDGASRKTIVFGDRFPFRYFADAYGLTYFAAFSGCSTETEASAATIKFLIDKVNEEKIPVVFSIELSSGKIADTICEATGAVKLELHSAHNVTKDDFENGVTYLDVMWNNVETLREALR